MHCRSSANYPQSNGRAELGVKAATQLLIIDNTKSDGSLDNNKAAQAIMQYRNTPLPYINLSPAQILLHRQLRDHIPANPVHCKLQKDWIISANQREKALAQRNENIAKKYNVSTRQLPEVPIEYNCSYPRAKFNPSLYGEGGQICPPPRQVFCYSSKTVGARLLKLCDFYC